MIEIFHFHNGKKGGVFSVIKNLIKFSDNKNINNHIIFVIKEDDKNSFTQEYLEGAITQKIFYYSSKNNFYYTCKKLAKLLPNKNAVIVAHDWLELGMVSNLGLQNKVICFLHGDYMYYYELAKKHIDNVDLFIAVSKSIEDNLIQTMPEYYSRFKYLRFPVPDVLPNVIINSEINIAFVGRLSNFKGYDLLPKIAMDLRIKNIFPVWNIFGTASEELAIIWNLDDKVNFYGEVSNDEILEKMVCMNFFLLPSKAEGMPVSIIEAMKCGVIPLVSNLDGGIQELIIENVTGFKIKIDDSLTYANKIEFLIKNELDAKRMRNNCIEFSKKMFHPILNTSIIEENIIEVTSISKRKKAKKIYGSRLDNPFIPNFITKYLRKKLDG